jgi:hypothetical protein
MSAWQPTGRASSSEFDASQYNLGRPAPHYMELVGELYSGDESGTDLKLVRPRRCSLSAMTCAQRIKPYCQEYSLQPAYYILQTALAGHATGSMET